MPYTRLRFVNAHVYKDKIKFEDWKWFEHFLAVKVGELFKLNLKNRYRHIGILEPYGKFPGFSWAGKIRFLFSQFRYLD